MNWLASHCPTGCTVTKVCELVCAKLGADPANNATANAQARIDLMARVLSSAAIANSELRSSRQSSDQGYDEEDDKHPEQQPGGLHCEASDPAESDSRRDQRDHQEQQRIVKQVTHCPTSI